MAMAIPGCRGWANSPHCRISGNPLFCFEKKAHEACEGCGLGESLPRMDVGSPGQPQEAGALGEDLGSQKWVDHAGRRKQKYRFGSLGRWSVILSLLFMCCLL